MCVAVRLALAACLWPDPTPAAVCLQLPLKSAAGYGLPYVSVHALETDYFFSKQKKHKIISDFRKNMLVLPVVDTHTITVLVRADT